MKLRIFYDAPSDTGGGLQPSLADMKAGRVAKPAAVIPIVTPVAVVEPIKPGDGTPVIENAEEAAAAARALAEKNNKPATADPAKPVEEPIVAKTPEEAAEEQRLLDEAAQNQLTDEQFVANFWKAVDDKSGRPIKVEYPTGVDPLSPDGVFLREQAVREDAERAFEAAIKNANPRGYAYLMHLQNGGTDEQFLGKGVGLSLPERSAVEATVEVQTMLVKMDLKAKGVEDEYVTAIVDKAIKDNKLKEMSLKAYDGILADQKLQLQKIELQEQNALETERQIGVQFNGMVDKAIANMRFIIPDTEKVNFKAFLDDNIRIDNNKLYIVQPIDNETLSQQLEAMYLLLKKGDLTKIVQKQASTITAQRLRTQIDATKTPGPKSGEEIKPKTESIPLAELFKRRVAAAAKA